MKFLCLVYNDEANLEAMSEDEFKSFVDEHLTLGKDLHEQGRLIAAEGLQPVNTAHTVRFRGGKLTVTDGPFAETKEQLGGFYLIDAANIGEAIQTAARIPPVRMGSIEVRPIRELKWSDGTPRHGRADAKGDVL